LLNHLDRFLWVNKTEEIYSAFILEITFNKSYKLSGLETLFLNQTNQLSYINQAVNVLVSFGRGVKIWTIVGRIILLQLSLVFIFVSIFFKQALALFHIGLSIENSNLELTQSCGDVRKF